MKKIINRHIACYIKAIGTGLSVGKEYTACLYQSVKDDIRVRSTAQTQDVDGVITCIFEFTPEQTAQLKTGPVILEIYDSAQNKMRFEENFATVRATSLD